MDQLQVTGQQRRKRKLLIIDDERKLCAVLTQYFSLKGYEVRSVCRGEEALALLNAFPPDVVLLDLLMPGMSGIDTLKALTSSFNPLSTLSCSVQQITMRSLMEH